MEAIQAKTKAATPGKLLSLLAHKEGQRAKVLRVSQPRKRRTLPSMRLSDQKPPDVGLRADMHHQIADASDRLREWAEWVIRHESSYPTLSPQGRMIDEGPLRAKLFGCRIPDGAMMPHRLAIVDRIYRDMPLFARMVVEVHYLGSGSIKDKRKVFAKRSRINASAYYHSLNQVLAWVASRLAMPVNEGHRE